MLFILLMRIYLYQYLLPFIIIFLYCIVNQSNATSPIPNNACPSNQVFYGPCIGGECPPDCPAVCTCITRTRACCTTLQNGTNGGGRCLTLAIVYARIITLPQIIVFSINFFKERLRQLPSPKCLTARSNLRI
ncbi:unnamed protein product [Meloidogyne enterolobii]|uniref:Uncharacterized protein n=1 Tax=Meloidogyne enterolobii TaxID=390850 RepID=A0ACB0XMA1_MELEN